MRRQLDVRRKGDILETAKIDVGQQNTDTRRPPKGGGKENKK